MRWIMSLTLRPRLPFVRFDPDALLPFSVPQGPDGYIMISA